MKNFALHIITSEGIVYENHPDLVTIPGTCGYLGILANHSPLGTTLKPGIMTINQGDKCVAQFYIEGGYAHVTPTKMVVMANYAENLEGVNADNVQQRLKETAAESPLRTRMQTMADVISNESILLQN